MGTKEDGKEGKNKETWDEEIKRSRGKEKVSRSENFIYFTVVYTIIICIRRCLSLR